MTRAEALRRLRGGEAELRSLGIDRLALFGSTARDAAGPGSDVDVAARLRRDMKIGVIEYVDLHDRLVTLLGVPVDLVSEPARRSRLQHAIDRDRVDVF